MYRVTIVWSRRRDTFIVATEAEAYTAVTDAMNKGAIKATFERI